MEGSTERKLNRCLAACCVELFVDPSSPGISNFINTSYTIRSQIGGCPLGTGLAPHALVPELLVCQVCPASTYNLNGDGRRYLCQDPTKESRTVDCFGRAVIGLNGYYATLDKRKDPAPGQPQNTPSGGATNALWIQKCNFGYCDALLGCLFNRVGEMCA